MNPPALPGACDTPTDGGDCPADPLDPPPPLRPGLASSRQRHRGEDMVIVKDPGTRRFFRVSAAAWELATRFDGRTSIAMLARADRTGAGAGGEAGPLPVTPGEVREVARRMAALGLLEDPANGSPDAAAGTSPEEARRPPGERRSILHLRWSLGDPDRLLARGARILGWLFTTPAALAGTGIVATAAVLSVVAADRVGRAMEAAFAPAGLPWLYVATAATLTLHEMAHGLTARRFGAEVREMGVMLLYFLPCAYTDVTDAYRIPGKGARIAVSLAGSAADLLAWSLATLAAAAMSPGGWQPAVAGAFIVSGGLKTVLFNLNPLIRLDGYYVLVDLLEMPNLGSRADAVVADRLRGWLGRASRSPERGRDRRILEVYGWLSRAWLALVLVLVGTWVDARLVEGFGGLGRAAWIAAALCGILAGIARRVARRSPMR